MNKLTITERMSRMEGRFEEVQKSTGRRLDDVISVHKEHTEKLDEILVMFHEVKPHVAQVSGLRRDVDGLKATKNKAVGWIAGISTTAGVISATFVEFIKGP